MHVSHQKILLQHRLARLELIERGNVESWPHSHFVSGSTFPSSSVRKTIVQREVALIDMWEGYVEIKLQGITFVRFNGSLFCLRMLGSLHVFCETDLEINRSKCCPLEHYVRLQGLETGTQEEVLAVLVRLGFHH